LNLQPTGFTKKYIPLRTSLLLKKTNAIERSKTTKGSHHTQLTGSAINANSRRVSTDYSMVSASFSSFLFNIPFSLPHFPLHRMMTSDRQKPFYPLGSLCHLQKNEQPPHCPHSRYSNQYIAWPTAELSSLLLTTSCGANRVYSCGSMALLDLSMPKEDLLGLLCQAPKS